MATLNLGRIKPVFKGAYNNATAYVVDDIVTESGSTYICIQNSTGNAVTNTTYWSQMAVGGTDVGTTITTQGDILYRDGSGLARLPAGTSGQVLQTGGTGANPSWTTMSSDMVKIKTIDVSDVTSAEIVHGVNDVIFDGTYETYKLYINDYYSHSTANAPSLQITTDSGSTYKSSGYNHQAFRVYYSGNIISYNQESTHVKIGTFGASLNASGARCFIEVTFSKPTNTYYPDIRGLHYGAEEGQAMIGMFHGRYQTAGAYNGFKIYQDGGGNFSAKFILYGIKG